MSENNHDWAAKLLYELEKAEFIKIQGRTVAEVDLRIQQAKGLIVSRLEQRERQP